MFFEGAVNLLHKHIFGENFHFCLVSTKNEHTDTHTSIEHPFIYSLLIWTRSSLSMSASCTFHNHMFSLCDAQVLESSFVKGPENGNHNIEI